MLILIFFFTLYFPMNRKHSSLMDPFFSSFNSSTYCLFYLLIPFAIHPVPDHFIAGKVWQRYGKRHKKPSAKPGNRVPRMKVLNYLKKAALFFRFERDILADGAQVIGCDAEKRGEVLQGKVMHDAGTTT